MMKRQPWKFILAIIWLVSSVALASWWLIFGLSLVNGTHSAGVDEYPRFSRMLLSEGLFLISLLIVGGISLVYFIWNESERRSQLQDFFAAFTHDVRTSIASLRLQAEALQEGIQGGVGTANQEKWTRRLVQDTVRLELQLSNSLFLARAAGGKLLLETINLETLASGLRLHWPDLQIDVSQGCAFQADRRALESILGNLIQNAWLHGRAKNILISAEQTQSGQGILRIADDGDGFTGSVETLGLKLGRHSATSGSGIGLNIVRKLCADLGWKVQFATTSPKGFCATFEFSLEPK